VEGSTTTVELGVVVERRPGTTPWQAWLWRPVAVVPGLGASGEEWRPMVEGPGWSRWLAGSCTLELHRKETHDYRVALSAEPPRLWVVLRRREDAERPWRPFLVTASPFEAQAYAEPGDDLVEAVAMPEPIVALVQDFVDRHHVDLPFLKRRRRAADAAAGTDSEFRPLDGREEP
jgi:hypothetical protein